MVKTQIHMHWSVINQKIKTFRDFRVFVINPIPKNGNSEIREIHQKPKILKCGYVTSKTFENAVQKTSTSKWFSHIADHIRQRFPVISGFSFWTLYPKREARKSQVLQKDHNTEMRECSYNAVQMTSNSKSCDRLLSFECFWPSRFTKVSLFLIISVLRMEKLRLLSKTES